MTIEQWLPVVGYEGLYEVSNLGRIKSLKRQRPGKQGGELKERIRKTHVGHKDYHMITLTKNSIKKTYRVHVLVANSFIGPRSPGEETRHLNGDKNNNTLTNLAYGLPEINCHESKIRYPDKCHKGHDLTTENNIYRRKDQPGTRICRVCHNERQSKYHAKKQ